MTIIKQKFPLTVIILFFVSFFLACNSKNNEQDFNQLTDEQKIQLLDAQIKNNPKDDNLYYQRALVFFDMNNSKDALLSIKDAIKLNKKNVKYYILEADIFFSKGETTFAFNSLQEAVNADKKSTEAYLKIAELSLYLKDYKKCFQALNSVMELDKVNATAYFIRGWAWKETGDTVKAVKDYKKAIELKSDYEEPFEELGLLYVKKGDGIAVDYLKSAIKINPQNVNAMYALGLFYQDNGAYQQALDMYQQILKIKPDFVDALNNTGWINYQYKQDYNTALELFTKAIQTDSNFYLAWYNRSDTYEKLGNRQKALEDRQKADSLMADNQQ